MAENAMKFLSKVVSVSDDGKTGSVKFTLGDGRELTAKLADFPAQIITQLALHGLSQKVGDSAAGFSKDRDYAGAFDAMDRVRSNLHEGKFNGDREGNSREDLILAVSRIQKIDVEAVRKTLAKATPEKITELQKHPAIKKELAQIKAERLAAAVEDKPFDLNAILKG